MSENEYEEDFDDYDEDFESDNDLEVPDQPQQATTLAGVADDAWPSLTAAAAVKQKPRTATFTRSLITGVTGPGSIPPSTADGVSYTISPAAPPLTDTQRSRASKTLNRSLQQLQQVKLSLSPVYELLLLQPMSAYQQLTLGVGAYAGRIAAASQTRQMDQELHEQDVQTEEVESQDGSCQVPDAAPSSSSSSSRRFNRSISATSTAAAAASKQATAAASKLLDSDAVGEFLEWAVPETIFELSKAAAAAAAAAEQEGSRAAGARRGLPFEPSSISQTTSNDSSSRSSSTHVSRSQPQLIAGQLSLQRSSLLSGRTVLAIACPSTAVAAAATAAAISAATAAATISSHLLLCCCSPIAMSAEAALREHGLPGLGCLCIWDLQQQQQQGKAAAAGGRSNGGGTLVQLLVTDGRPTCCCWGAGAGCSLVFAGMGEGGVCCWDLSEPDSTHAHQQQQQSPTIVAQQQQQQCPTPRRPSYTSQVPLTILEDMFNNSAGSSSSSSAAFDAALSSSADSIVAVAAVAPAAGSASAGAAAVGAVCQLITLSSSCNVVLYSVMMGGAGGAAAAAAGGTDLGMRSGSRVWLVKLLEGLPLGIEAAKPPHLRSPPPAAAAAAMQATSLLHLPGANQQILVGISSSCILRGACLGTPPPPRHYTAASWELLGFGSQSLGLLGLVGLNNALDQTLDSSDHTAMTSSDRSYDSSVSSSSCLGSVVSLSVCSLVPEAWLAGFSSGGVGLFTVKKSRPVLIWQQLRPAAVVAVRWIPTRPCVFLVLHADGQLLAFDLSQDTKQPLVMADLQGPAAAAATNGSYSSNTALPCSMEVLVHSSTSTSAAVPVANNSRDLRFRASSKSSRRGTAEAQGGSGTAAGGAAAQCSLAVGYDDGVTVVYQLGTDWSSSQQQEDEEQILQQLFAG